jgi:arginine decarboxylase
MSVQGSHSHPKRRQRPHQYDAAQLRRDTWNDLQFHAHWLHEMAQQRNGLDEPLAAVTDELDTLECLEGFWAYPSLNVIHELKHLFANKQYEELARKAKEITRMLVSDAYRTSGLRGADPPQDKHRAHHSPYSNEKHHGGQDRHDDKRPYFEVLIVDDIDEEEHEQLREALLQLRRDDDEFIYDIVFARSFEDAAIAILFNHTIQSCVFRYNLRFKSDNPHPVFSRYLDMMRHEKPARVYGVERTFELGRVVKALRPELDLFVVTDSAVEDIAGRLGRVFRRVFYRLDNYLELHLSIIKGIRSRYETPFFDALRKYAQRPTGVFHALPIARGKSITNSHWAKDMGSFYGQNIFLAETSTTSGGLDSLLQPHGTIKRSQDLAARAFGAHRTYFATNGTSTANKIVVQALVRPGDIVLVAHDCHKSHHYAMVLAGSYPVYLDAYPLTEYTMYGAVPLREIKHQLLQLKREGKLDRVRMLLLTNCTFDGITYHPEKIMREVLAIKPDMIFLWDEAWFAFAGFNPTLRMRTGMYAAKKLQHDFQSEQYRAKYRDWREAFDKLDPDDDATWLDQSLMADPDAARVRVYATQSTHKTLTSLRQGSMIHVFDEDFEQHARDAFNEAFMTHTSTSPNYQIIASLDVGRRQMELEGYEMVQKSISLAMTLRERIYSHPIIKQCFSVLRPADLIPENYRPSGLEFYYDPDQGWSRMEEAWRNDEFALDPTRVSVHVGHIGVDGDTLRHLLIDQHDIQINKTSRNTVLFLTNIGMSRGDVAHLVEVLGRIGQELQDRLASSSEIDRRLHERKVRSLTEELPPLPNFSHFHPCFKPDPSSPTAEGDIRRAFFMAYDVNLLEHYKLGAEIDAVMATGRELISAAFITPYPPGFPVLVPGQVITRDILDYLLAVDVKEIHGYKPEYGLRVFTEDAIEKATTVTVEQPVPNLTETGAH